MSESRQNFKLKPKEKFISTQLLTNIIKSSDISKAVVEEPTSELWYETLNGNGTIIFKNNVTYEGFLKYGILNNEDPENPCTISFPDGTKYVGTIINNEITGVGTYTFEDGSTYKGEVLNGLREGKGSYKTLDGIFYEGEWKNGLKHGKGKIIQGNMELEGEWENGILNGKCRIKWKTGNIFDGELINNNMNGNGYMIWFNKNEKYTGMWKNNLQNGYGIHIWYDTKNDNKFFRDRYVGEWKDGKRDGYGKFYYSNGNIYEGQWKNNQKEGFGIFYYQDRSKYIGSFKSDNLIDSINLKSTAEDMNKTKTAYTKDKKYRINKNIDEIKILISINDLINSEPETKKSLKEIDNLILRNLSVITHLYLYGSGKEDFKTMDIGLSSLGGGNPNETRNYHKQMSRKNSRMSIDNTNNNLKQLDSQVIEKKIEKPIDYDNVYNNDLYFCLDFLHFWKLIRECGLITPEISLAMIDRICYQNPDNIIEMFYIPEELSRKNNIKGEKDVIYDYIYKNIQKSKFDFENKYKSQIEKSQVLIYGVNKENEKKQNVDKNNKKVEKEKEKEKEKNKNVDKNNKKVEKEKENENEKNEENKNEYEHNINYHDEKNVILLRYFYEIIIRIAYIRYSENPNMPLVERVKGLIDELKVFLRARLKSGNNDSSIASILMIDPKLKNVDTLLDKFISDHYINLNKIFIDLYEYSCDNEFSYKKYDMTITYGFFYDNIILKSEALSKIFKNKLEYIDIISIYIKDKLLNSYNFNSVSKLYSSYEIMEYIDNLLDYEMIFREFCELIFFISRKYFIFYGINKEEEENTINNNKSISVSKKNEEFKKKQNKIIKRKNSSMRQIKLDSKEEKDSKESKENNKECKEINKEIDNYKIVINYIIQEKNKLIMGEKYTGVDHYSYPVLKTHQTITKLIENEEKRKIEEERKERERQRYTLERKLLKEEDLNVYKEEEEQSSESLDEDL